MSQKFGQELGKKKIALISAALLALVAFAHKPAAQAGNGKISPFLMKQMDAGSYTKALVVFRAKADLSGAAQLETKAEKGRFVYDALRKVALESQGPLMSWLDARKIVYRRHYIINFLELPYVSADAIREIAQRDDVERVLSNPSVRSSEPPASTGSRVTKEIEPGVTYIGAQKVWEKYGKRGEGIVVASADTGVMWEHPAIARQYRGAVGTGTGSHEYNWYDAIHWPIGDQPDPSHPRDDGSENDRPCRPDHTSPCPDGDHGTHTVGTMVGEAPAPVPAHGRPGVAPGAKWIACRNMEGGVGSPASYVECNEFFLAPTNGAGSLLTDGDPSLAPHVVNNSWGCPPDEGCEPAFMRPAFQALAAAGIFVVASAGNDGPSCATIKDPPAVYSGDLLTVGALDAKDDTIAFFSSRGPSKLDGGLGPDIAAPGVNVYSSTSNPGSGYNSKDGTSMAGPHVAGAVALLWSVRPKLIGKIKETREILLRTARPLKSTQACGGVDGSAHPNAVFGYGALDVSAAVDAASGF